MMDLNRIELAVDIARQFSGRIQTAISADQFKTVVELNLQETNQDVCHSHDFVDADVIMLEAFASVLDECDLQNEDDLELLNVAWTIAREANFYASNSNA